MRIINETVALVLAGKYQHGKIPSCATLKMCDETPIFIPVDITEDTVKLVALKPLGSPGPGGMESESLQGWILKLREDSKILPTRVVTFVDWLANKSPPWAAYRAFMSGRLIVLDK